MKYSVIMWKTFEQTISVEARDEDEASEIAFNKWNLNETKVVEIDSQIMEEKNEAADNKKIGDKIQFEGEVMKLIGLSVSQCIKDIIEGKVNPDDVMYIIGE